MSHFLISKYIDLLVERISCNLSESAKALEEAKIDQVIKQYENDHKLVEFLNDVKKNGVLPKYINLAIKAFRETPYIAGSYTASLVKDVTSRFETYLANNLVPTDKKDVGKFETWRAFKEFVSVDLTKKANAREVEKREQLKVKNEATRYFEDGTYLIIEPKTERTSCMYGRDTKWCISATETQNHFEDYSSSGVRFLFIINKKNNDKDAISFRGSEIEIYDAADKDKKPEYISSKYPPYIVEKLNEILLELAGDNPFVSINIQELSASPLSFLDWPNPDRIKKLASEMPEILGSFLPKLMLAQPTGTPEEIIFKTSQKRKYINFLLTEYINKLTLTSMQGQNIWHMLENDPNYAMWDLAPPVERKALYLCMTHAIDAQNAPKFKFAALVAVYSPMEAGNILKSQNFEALHKQIAESNPGENTEAVVIVSRTRDKLNLLLKSKIQQIDSATLLDSLLPIYPYAPVINSKSKQYWVEVSELLSISQNLLNYWNISNSSELLDFLGAAYE